MGRSTLFKGYKIQWAKRSTTNPDRPASVWKTVPDTNGMRENEIDEMMPLLRAQHPDRMFRGWLA